MTFEEAFIKGASDRFEEVKMANWTKLVNGLMNKGLSGGAKAWGKMQDPVKYRMIGTALGGAGGVGTALASRDKDESLGTTFGRAVGYGGLGALGGGLIGRYGVPAMSKGIETAAKTAPAKAVTNAASDLDGHAQAILHALGMK